MTRRRLAIAALVVVAFVAGVAATLPTDAIVRRLLARAPLPSDLQLDFSGAHLWPTGLRLDDVHLTHRDGRPAFDAEWLRLRPSLWGLWRDRTGRPWHIAAGTCQGRIDVDIGVEAVATPVTVELENIEVASCLAYAAPYANLYARLNGTIHARLASRDPASGDGDLEIRGAAWRPGGVFEDLTIRADAGSVRAQLEQNRFTLETLEATSVDFALRGRGSIRLNSPVRDSVLDLRLLITPGRSMPLVLRRWFDSVPGAPPAPTGARTLRVQGTIGDPRVVAAGTFE